MGWGWGWVAPLHTLKRPSLAPYRLMLSPKLLKEPHHCPFLQEGEGCSGLIRGELKVTPVPRERPLRFMDVASCAIHPPWLLCPDGSGVSGNVFSPFGRSNRCSWEQELQGAKTTIFCVESVRAPSPSGHEAQQRLFKITMCCPFSDYKSNTYSWSKIWKIQKSTKKKIHPYSTTQKPPLLIFEVYHLSVLFFFSDSLSLSFNRNLMQ